MSLISKILHQLVLWVAFLLPASFCWRLLAWPYRRSHARLRAAMATLRSGQLRTLQRIVTANRQTEFGRAHAFDQIKDWDSYRARVPLRAYSEFEPYIERHRRGESAVLVAGNIVGFAVSGGSRGHPKPIPVTSESLQTWVWAEELLAHEAIRHYPAVARGRTLHLLPCFQEQTSRSTLPIAPMPVLADAAAGEVGLPSVLPHQVFAIPDEHVRYYLLLRLALTQPVSVLRAACPGTLTILAEHLELQAAELLEDLSTGKIRYLDAMPEAVRQLLAPQRPALALATQLRQQAARRGRLEPRDLWPTLALLVCATTGSAQIAVHRLADRFGSLPVLDPGYRAAEGVLTWPWMEGEGGLPVGEGHVLECLPEGEERGTTLTLEELVVGRRYQPVLTSTNGLYRYVMDDVVEVLETRGGKAPRVTMVGRSRFSLRLRTGKLDEEAFGEAISVAARGSELLLAGYTAWLQRESVEANAAEGGQASWLQRLFSRGPAKAQSEAPRPALSLAIEPSSSLLNEQARRLLSLLDSELRRSCAAYAEGRATGGLGRPSLIALRPGTFARTQRQRLAEGASGAHAPVPVLAETSWLVEEDDVVLAF